VSVGLCHDGWDLDSGELVEAQVPWHALEGKDPDVVKPTGLENDRALNTVEFFAAVLGDIQCVAEEGHARSDGVEIATVDHRPIGMAGVLPHEGELRPIAPVGGDRTILRPIEAHHAGRHVHGKERTVVLRRDRAATGNGLTETLQRITLRELKGILRSRDLLLSLIDIPRLGKLGVAVLVEIVDSFTRFRNENMAAAPECFPVGEVGVQIGLHWFECLGFPGIGAVWLAGEYADRGIDTGDGLGRGEGGRAETLEAFCLKHAAGGAVEDGILGPGH